MTQRVTPATPPPTELLISTCALKDIGTWSVAAKYITINIKSQAYWLIVPAKDVAEFANCSPREVQVISEDEVIPSSFLSTIADHLDSSTGQASRKYWLYQQFLKMQSAIDSRRDRIVLWDADTVPIRPIQFFDENLRARHFCGNEYHKPYFDLMKTILGLNKTSTHSFVAQCIPLRRKWLVDLCIDIECRTGANNWKEGILRSIGPSLGDSPFSEYETIGTYAVVRLDEAEKPLPQINSQAWLRNGYEYIGPAANLFFFNHPVFRDAAFVSFERWSKPFYHYSSALSKKTTSLSKPLTLRSFKSLIPMLAQLRTRGVIVAQRLCRIFLTHESAERASFESEDSKVSRFLSDFFSSAPLSHVLQIGANDGVMEDPLRSYLPTHQGPVVLVEALPYYCNKLSKNYSRQKNVRVINALIASKEEERVLYYIDPQVADEMDGDGPMNRWAHGQASLSRDCIVSWIYSNQFRGRHYRANMQRYINSIQQLSMITTSLARLAESCQFTEIELLVIDVQGAELEVLSSLHQLSSLPRFLLYEDDTSLDATDRALLEEMLSEAGYIFIAGNSNKLWGLDSASSRNNSP